MKELNLMRLAAGLPIDASIEITEKAHITEARDTPKRKADLRKADAKSLKSKKRGLEQAVKYIGGAIEALEKIPAIDFSGDVPRFIGELEDLLDTGGSGGMEDYLEMVTSELRKAESVDKKEQRKTEEEEQYAELEAAEAEAAFDAEVENDRKKAEIYKNSMKNEDENIGDFIKNLSVEQRNQLHIAMDALQQMAGGAIIGESNAYKVANKITEGRIEEAMHYYDVQYPSSHEANGDKPINVSDGSANGEQVMDTLPPTKKESPAQLKKAENGKEESNKPHDDMNKAFKVPNGIKQALRTEIDAANKESKSLDSRDKDASYFYKDLANAFEDLLKHLEKGTLYDFKQAQNFAQTLMGPMLHKIPTEVWKFLTNGGETRSLKSYMSPVDKKFAGFTAVKK